MMDEGDKVFIIYLFYVGGDEVFYVFGFSRPYFRVLAGIFPYYYK